MGSENSTEEEDGRGVSKWKMAFRTFGINGLSKKQGAEEGKRALSKSGGI